MIPFSIGNRKSGNNDGGQILSLFRRLLNPAQIMDLAERDPVAALEWCRLLGKTPCTVLVAGGDGTIAWLLNTIHKLSLKVLFIFIFFIMITLVCYLNTNTNECFYTKQPVPSVAIIPLGTGNDLSRVLGWGKEHDKHMDPVKVLLNIWMAQEIKLDRYEMNIFTSLTIRSSFWASFWNLDGPLR